METNTDITTQLASRGIDDAIWSAIGSSIFPGATEESKLLAFDYCKARGLDIMKKPCHIVPMSVKDAKTGQYSWRDVIMPGIADHRITASRTGEYAGQDAPVFGEMVDLKIGNTTHLVPEFCTVTVYRLIKGIRVPIPHTEFFEEACGTVKDGGLNSMWTKRKRGQLAKCAEAGALRKAFPEELGGTITADEAQPEMRDVTREPRKLTVREEAINPFPETIKPEAAESAPEPPLPAHAETIPATGRPKKDRHVRDAVFKGITKKSGGGATWFDVSVIIKKGDTSKGMVFTTFSTSDAEVLREMETGTPIRITVVSAKAGENLALEAFELIEGGVSNQ